MRVSSLQEAENRYGAVLNGVWADEPKWCTFVPIPAGIRLVNSLSGFAMGRVYCNRDMAAPLEQAFKNVVDRNMGAELETFDGCLMVRDVRGEPGQLSTHAYALAIDLNAKKNPLGGPVTFSAALVKCFTDAGFSWGGSFHRVDGMHFSFAWEK